ncbi:methyltransferase [Stella sp.]|uniref:methyltransferase n=1 Tax=Stella sp. TaxID=2912054 RepID=UPI0035B4B5FC
MAGYPTGVAYPATHQPRIAPAHLAAVAWLAGAGHPAIDRPYRFCELGSGTGFTTNLLAAANPFAEFHAVDFNPAHVAEGRRLAEAGALPNVRHHALDFAAARAALPDLDFVALHGVWTWVDDAARRDVLAFLAERLRPGGLVYVSYTARPGMDGVAALRGAMAAAGLLADDRPPPERLARLAGWLARLRAAQPEFAEGDPTLAAYVEALPAMDEAGALHDLLAPDWRAEFHGSVRAAMATAGLDWVGDADLAMNLPGAGLPPAQAALLAAGGGEAVKDLLLRRAFRRDVYRRPGPAAATPLRWFRKDGGAGEPTAEVVAAGGAVPLVAAPSPPAGLPRLSPFNRTTLELGIGREDARIVAGTTIGGGVVLDRTTAYLLSAVAAAGPGGGARMMACRLAAEGRGISAGGRTVTDPAGLEHLIAPRIAQFEATDLPRLRRLGAVA